MTYTTPIFGTIPTLGVDLSTSGYDQPYSATASNPNNPEYPQQPFQIGTVITMSNGGEAIYAQTATATSLAQGNFCYINNLMLAAGLTSAIAATAGQGARLGICLATLTTGQYGWFQTNGYNAFGVTVTTAAAAYATLHTSATAGVLTTAVVTGTSFPINNITTTTTSAATAGAYACVMNNPVINTATTLG